MAFGYLCKNCGRDEQAHDGGHSESDKETRERRSGRRYSLESCPYFELSEQMLSLERKEVLDHIKRHGEGGLTRDALARHQKAIAKSYDQ